MPDARRRTPGPTRRQFLHARGDSRRGRTRRSARFLAACSKSGPSSASAPTPDDRRAGQPGEVGHRRRTTSRSPTGSRRRRARRCRLYNYADYLSPEAVKAFEEKYGIKVQISTFNDTDEALTKIRGGNVDFDIYFPSYDQISQAGDRRAWSGRSTTATSRTSRTCGRASPTPGTTRGGATPCRTPSTPPASAGGPTRCPPTSAR